VEAVIEKDTDRNGVSYVELKISPSDPEDDVFFITFRKYPKRVFVGVEDERDSPFGGADLEDCWLAPVVIIQKILIEEFKPFDSFMNAMKYLGLIEMPVDADQGNYNAGYYEDQYIEIERVVEEWRKL
jgi:hypothetical protein